MPNAASNILCRLLNIYVPGRVIEVDYVVASNFY